MAKFSVRNGKLVASGLNSGSLEDSIAKWRYLLRLTHDDRLVNDGSCFTCSLCTRYLFTWTSCVGCPIAEHTGQSNCFNTPYEDYYNAWSVGDLDRACSAAEAMVEFLESLDAD